MKRYQLISLAYIICITTSCEYDDFEPSEWSIEPELSLSTSGVVFNSVIGSQKVGVVTNYKSYQVSSNQEWCKVSSEKDSVLIEVEPNEKTDQRIATVRVDISRGKRSLSKSISVVQMGGIWDIVGGFNVFWRYDISEAQREAIKELLSSMVYVEGGTFYMGESSELHKVTLSSFYIGKFELTQKQWGAIMATNPSEFRNPDLPVENISWSDALRFTSALSGLTNLQVNLPTEAQWEYSARGGKYSLNYEYAGSNDYEEVAHSISISTSETSPLFSTVRGGTKLPNELGLFDMSGNVAEYCSDWYDKYEMTESTDPLGPSSGTSKVIRGGDFSNMYWRYKVAYRWQCFSITHPSAYTGFRIVIIP